MTIEADLVTALSGVAGGRIYPDTTPDKPVFPCVVYQQVGGDVLNPLEGGDPGKDNARIQVWVWSKSALERASVMRQVRLAITTGTLKGWAFSAPIHEYNDTLKLYGARCDFGVWYTP